MSHVDEGLLHAWIDGAFPPGNEQGEEIEAHIALCVDCRVRMENARELKERAQVVMHRLAPDAIVAPPFEEILARRERQHVVVTDSFGPAAREEPRPKPLKGRRSDVFPIPFAWAATLILAVGAGWMGRELMLNGAAMDADTQTEEVRLSTEADVSTPSASDAAGRAALPAAPQASVADAGARGAIEDAGRTRNEAEQVQERPREAVTGFAPPPVGQLKAADAPPQPVVAGETRADSTPIVLRGIEAVAEPARAERRMLAAAVATVAADNVSRVTMDLSVLTAYVRASAESLWAAEPFAAVGLIGYEPIARLHVGAPVHSERAVVDSLELLRIVYVVEGDTVELVQELEQTAVTLDEIVVTGGVAGADSAGVRADSVSAAERARAAALPPPAARVDDQRNARAAVRMANALDSASVLASRSIVTLRRDERVVLLIGRVPEASLQALAEKVR